MVTDYLAWNLSEETPVEDVGGTSDAEDPATLFPDRPVVHHEVKSHFVARILDRVRTIISSRGGRGETATPTATTPPPSSVPEAIPGSSGGDPTHASPQINDPEETAVEMSVLEAHVPDELAVADPTENEPLDSDLLIDTTVDTPVDAASQQPVTEDSPGESHDSGVLEQEDRGEDAYRLPGVRGRSWRRGSCRGGEPSVPP